MTHLKLDHDAFTYRYGAGELDTYINLLKAADPFLPAVLQEKRWRRGADRRRWLTLALVPAAASLFFVTSWWLATVVTLAAGVAALWKRSSFSDTKLIRAAALEDARVYDALVAGDILRVLPRPNDGIPNIRGEEVWLRVEDLD